MNGHAQGFCLVTQTLEPLFTASKTALKKCCFHCYGHTLGFLPQTQKNSTNWKGTSTLIQDSIIDPGSGMVTVSNYSI